MIIVIYDNNYHYYFPFLIMIIIFLKRIINFKRGKYKWFLENQGWYLNILTGCHG